MRLCVRTRGVLSHKTLRFSVPTTVFLPRRYFQPTSTHSPTPLRSWDALGCGKCFGTARAARGAETSAAHAATLMAPKGRFPFLTRKSESAHTLRPKGCGWVGKNQTERGEDCSAQPATLALPSQRHPGTSLPFNTSTPVTNLATASHVLRTVVNTCYV